MQPGDFHIIEVSRLPWPHGLFRCPHKTLFDLAIADVPPNRPEDCSPLVGAAARSLSADQVGACPYHRPDWSLATETAISCWQAADGDDFSAVEIAISRRDLDEETLWAAWSLLAEPIWIDGPLLGNGQHRVCAMKLAGVNRCLVEK